MGFIGRIGPEHAGQDRHHHQRQDAGQVFHDQPADGDLAARGFKQAPFFHRAQQHHGTGGGQRETEHHAIDHRPAHQRRQAPAEQGGDQDLADRTRDGDRFDLHQVFEREMQTYPEHQQHHADLGQLVGQCLVGNEAGGERTYADACNQITDQGRQTQLVGQRAEDEGEPKANGNDVDQVGVMVHRGSQRGGVPRFSPMRPVRANIDGRNAAMSPWSGHVLSGTARALNGECAESRFPAARTHMPQRTGACGLSGRFIYHL
ncbi:hypothetical protein D3C71_1296360 [compost metagenome]